MNRGSIYCRDKNKSYINVHIVFVFKSVTRYNTLSNKRATRTENENTQWAGVEFLICFFCLSQFNPDLRTRLASPRKSNTYDGNRRSESFERIHTTHSICSRYEYFIIYTTNSHCLFTVSEKGEQ